MHLFFLKEPSDLNMRCLLKLLFSLLGLLKDLSPTWIPIHVAFLS